jgi:hypothetical protein
VGLVCITLLEGYFEGVRALIRALRELGCRAHIAVGGVMPSLAPEHVAVHLPEVSFICRGAGEVFVPRLAEIIGEGDVDQPLAPGQRDALLALDGLIAIDRAGGVVLCANTAQIVTVSDLDRVELDLSWLTRRHLHGGIELTTSRGCIHRCTFCSILGRESYQARSAGNVLEVLAQYEARFTELFGDAIPDDVWRVHMADDDFACDADRARAFFEAVLDTRFRLSSVQVSIADLCERVDGKLVPVPDKRLLDAIRPECFADHGRVFPERDFVADFATRQWSSYLQLGVESYSDRELIRLGKGYRRIHVRAIVAEMARRQLHMDGYFILCNADTTADELIDVVDEICRLKLRWATWFHVRFPIVPRLVSYFTSASHRRLVRKGRTHAMKLRELATVAGYPEFDYPFVDFDVPDDAWVDAVADVAWFTDEGRYTGSLDALRELWRARAAEATEADERRRGQQLVRRLDDRPRRLVFELLAHTRHVARTGPDPEWPDERVDEATAIDAAVAVLGPAPTWIEAYKRYDSNEVPRLVVIPTWQCELRCSYCYIPKQDGRVASLDVIEGAIDMLLASDRDRVILQFFGGEALLEFERLQHAIRYGNAAAAAADKGITYIISSNGWSLDADKLAWLADHPVELELSLDGPADIQARFRRSYERGANSYDNSVAHRAEAIKGSGLVHQVIMVVHPDVVDRMPESFWHIVGLGFERVQINFALGMVWTEQQKQSFATGLFAIGTELRQRWAAGERVMLVNLENAPMPIRLNAEITVDWDGAIYGGNAFLHETAHKAKFRVGHLDDLGNFERYWMDAPSNEELLEWSYPPDVTRNNLGIGAVFTSFLKWMHKAGLREVS